MTAHLSIPAGAYTVTDSRGPRCAVASQTHRWRRLSGVFTREFMQYLSYSRMARKDWYRFSVP